MYVYILLWDFEKRRDYSSLDLLFVLRNYGGQFTENEKGELFACVRRKDKCFRSVDGKI